MSASTHHGALVLLAFVPVLPLMMRLRRRKAGGPRAWRAAGAISSALCMVGAGIALFHGAF